MQAIVMHETGGPEVLRLEEVDRPEPGDGEVLVRVHDASVNPIDWKFRRGLMPKELPAILGNDMAGMVEESRTEAFSKGDEVFGFAIGGTYAEFARSPAPAIAIKPPALSPELAAALPVVGLTAWQALFDRGGLQEGQTVVISAAAGGVGHLAVQFARKAGARTIGIGSARHREFVLDLGATDYVDYTSEDVTAVVKDADLAFDAVGGEITEQLLATVRPGGALVCIAGAVPEERAAEREVRAELLIMSPDPAQLASIGAQVASREVRVVIAERFPLAEVARAHELSETGHTRGKIVLFIG
ncbi:MAG TPA: NADP-dependent oxidoreductase [Solirubrobacteraceae bacterium]|nr:NADP-dependent oxidoreductase [Solirubrobacteraceae bacterium]